MTLPVLIVAGYLGAGKTTLINDFLADPGGRRTVVLVNDFGAINIDAALIETAQGDTIALTNGCACCAIGDDLLGAAKRAVASAPDLLIVEASGVSDPARMAMLLRGVSGVDPARILTVINGTAARRNAQDKFIGRLFGAQIASADCVAVNRGSEHATAAVARFAPEAEMVQAILDTLQRDTADLPPPSVDVLPEFQSRILDHPKPTSEAALRRWAARFPVGVHRAKGVVDTPQGVMKFDYCQGQTTVQTLPLARGHDVGKIVLIGPELTPTGENNL
jgi:G3E family GTPase